MKLYQLLLTVFLLFSSVLLYGQNTVIPIQHDFANQYE